MGEALGVKELHVVVPGLGPHGSSFSKSRPSVQVREVDCVGCRLCFNVCPVEDCIHMIEEPSGRPPVTWGQLSQTQREVTEDWEKMQKYRERMGIHIH